jgi:outer membrane immunogenic protein
VTGKKPEFSICRGFIMKKFLIAATAVSGLLAFAGSASAADPIVDLPYDWSGLYIGAEIGGLWGEGDTSIPAYPATFDLSTDGWGGGLYAGYNFQSGFWVFGLEGDVNLLDVDGEHASGLVGEQYAIEQEWDASVRARAGYAIDNMLLYVTGGAAFSSIDTFYIPLAGGHDKNDLFGWTVGGGLEYGFTPNMTARVQYLYTDYGNESFFHNGPSTVDYDTHSVMAGIAWKF